MGSQDLKRQITFDDNPLHPDLSVNILHTVLYTFPLGADKENLFDN